MIEIYRTTDPDEIKSVLCHPVVYGLISDDGSLPREQFEPLIHELVYYIAARIDGELAAIYQLCAVNSICYDAHINILPRFWGRTQGATKEALRWVKENTHIKKLQGRIPENYRHVLNHVLTNGFEIEGRQKKSIMRRGVLLDQCIVGYRIDG